MADALGVPYEFHRPESIPPAELIEMVPPRGFRRAHAGVPAGTWSDDGAQALCLLASLLHRGSLDLRDFGNRLVNWLDLGYRAADGIVFDVGITSQQAIARIRSGVSPSESGGGRESDNGNGALMRVLPLALFHRGSDAELLRDARLSSVPTHAHLRSQLCCGLYCIWARRLLEGQSDGWVYAIEALRSAHAEGTPERTELEREILSFDPGRCAGTGYVVDGLHSARLCMESASYETAVKAAVALGNDTDTTACIVGGLAGIRWGLASIPARWQSALRGLHAVRDDIEQLKRL